MIFQTPNSIEKIVRGEKTQTRRITKPDHVWGENDDGTRSNVIVNVQTYRPIYWVGQNLAVQPGRGKRGMLYGELPMLCPIPEWATNNDPIRIWITAIRCEDVRQISEADARAEGYSNAQDFLNAWRAMHDPHFELYFDERVSSYAYRMSRKCDFDYADDWRWIYRLRPAERYQAWALTFEVVK